MAIFSDITDEETKHALSSLLIEQIDVNRDGLILMDELLEFIWKREGKRELGLVILQTREAVLQFIGPTFTESHHPEDKLLEAVAAFAKSFPSNKAFPCLRRGKVIESRALQRAFKSLFMQQRGASVPSETDKEEVASLMLSIDVNSDSVISAEELVKWLFPTISQLSESKACLLY